MNGLPLVADASIKLRCPTFSIRDDGEVDGYNHGSGFLIPELKGERKFRQEFIANQNAEKTLPWMIGFARSTSFHDLAKDSPILDLFLILVRRLYYCAIASKFFIAFHRFKGRGCCSSLYETIQKHRNNTNTFVQLVFHSECEFIDVDSIHITWVNQITGARLNEWNIAWEKKLLRSNY